jgi:hypothetical protein
MVLQDGADGHLGDYSEWSRSPLFSIAQGRTAGRPYSSATRCAPIGSDESSEVVCVREQRQSAAGPYTLYMHLESIKVTVATLWISAVCTVGIVGNVNSLSGWTVLAGLAILPPLVVMWRLNNPPQTMSESIQEARQ